MVTLMTVLTSSIWARTSADLLFRAAQARVGQGDHRGAFLEELFPASR